MKSKKSFFERWRISIEKRGMLLLRIAVGAIFLWFGVIKYFGHLSAAEDIAAQTISWLTFGHMQKAVSMPLLATIECIIGLGILTKKYMRLVLPLLYFQMAGTILPMFIFTAQTWKIFPLVPTLEGSYIIKNVVIISAAIVLGAVAKGSKLIIDPEVAQKAKITEIEKEQKEV